MCAFSSPQDLANESPQANESYEGIRTNSTFALRPRVSCTTCLWFFRVSVHLFRLKIMPMSHLKPMNRMKGIPTNSIFALQTWVSCTTCKWSSRDMCAFVSPKKHSNESPQANESYEKDSNGFYFRTSNTCFVCNMLLIFEEYVRFCFNSKSCQLVTSSQWIVWGEFEWILFPHFKHKFGAQHANGLWRIYVNLLHLKIMPLNYLKPMNHMKGIRTNSIFALQTRVSCTTC